MMKSKLYAKSADRVFRATRRRFLRSIKTFMVSALRLARRNEIVSRPPEKILSTETEEPKSRM